MISASEGHAGEPPSSDRQASIQVARVVSNVELCREHYRLTFTLSHFGDAQPGQFVHLCPEQPAAGEAYRAVDLSRADLLDDWRATCDSPMLRRAFSIAGLRRTEAGVEIDVIYRVVGTATRWMQSLRATDSLSVLGPLGNCFPVVTAKPKAWLVAGGVGLPPMLWLTESLSRAGVSATALCGAQSKDLLALSLSGDCPPAADATRATLCAAEFARHDVAAIISTDDGSAGFAGHIGAALEAYHRATSPSPTEVVMYTCGPERMMRFVAEFCAGRGIECHVCMERAMACGTGTCQSCVVSVSDEQDADGWRYRLCCTEGPVFSADDIVWPHTG